MSQENTMFTHTEAIELLQSWGINNVEERLVNVRAELVDEIVQVIHENVPFQSISLLATDVEKRKQLSFDEIKTRCVAGVGGLCYQLAPFTWGLFKALGFSGQMVSSTVTSTVTAPNNHAVLLISGVDDNNIHLVDCGTGFPTFRAISLNFVDESPVFRDSFLQYKYIRYDGKILRMHGKGDTLKRNNPPIEGLDFFLGDWRRFYSFIPDQKVRGANKPAEDACRVVHDGQTPLTSSPRAVWFPRKRAVVIVNNKLMLENEVGELVTTVLQSDEEIMNAYADHFPQLKKDDVRRALAEWRRQSN